MTAKKAPPSLKRNFHLYYLVSFFSFASFWLPICMLFGVEYLGVSYFQAGSLFLISWIVSLCFDFLTGTIADKYGRKKMFIIGISLQILGFLPYLFTKNYALLAAFSAVVGIGMALASNTLTALLYEQAKEQKALAYFQHATATANAFSYGGRVAASVIGGLVYLIHPVIPYGLTLVALGIALGAGVRMYFSKKVEEHAEHETNLKIMASAWKVFSSNAALVQFTIVICFISIWGDYIFNIYQPLYIEEHAVSSLMLGYIYAGISILSALGSLIMRRLPSRFSPHTINSFSLAGIACSALLLTVLDMPLIYIAPIGLAIVSGFSIPNLSLYVNQFAPSKIRSSVLSIATTASGIGSGIGIFVVLQLIDRISFQHITIICVIGCLIALILNGINALKWRE